MSTVTITPLTIGELATAANYNANATSWNSATANGVVDDDNVREQGIDRRTIADRTIDAQRSMTSSFKFVGTAASSAIPTNIATVVAMNAGAETAEVGPFTSLSGDVVLIRVSADFYTGQAGPNTGRGSNTTFYLRRSDDNWSSYTDLSSTIFYYQTNTAYTSDIAVCPCRGTYQITYKHAGGAGTWRYRLICLSVNETVVVDTCVMAIHVDAV